MSDMSKAIRLTVEKHAPGSTLQTLPLDVLRDFREIVGAYFTDLSGELERREANMLPPPDSVVDQGFADR